MKFKGDGQKAINSSKRGGVGGSVKRQGRRKEKKKDRQEEIGNDNFVGQVDHLQAVLFCCVLVICASANEYGCVKSDI